MSDGNKVDQDPNAYAPGSRLDIITNEVLEPLLDHYVQTDPARFGNGGLLITPFNEPQANDDVAVFLEHAAWAVDLFDSAGASRDGLMLNMPVWGQSIETLTNPDVIAFAQAHPEVGYAIHFYGAADGFDTALALQVMSDYGIKVTGTEFGFPHRSYEQNPVYVDAAQGKAIVDLIRCSGVPFGLVGFGFTDARHSEGTEAHLQRFHYSVGPSNAPASTDALSENGQAFLGFLQRSPQICEGLTR